MTCGKPGKQDQACDFVIAHGLPSSKQAPLNRTILYGRQIQSSAVVLATQHHLLALACKAQQDTPRARLHLRQPTVGHFHTMVDRISQQMEKRLSKPVEHIESQVEPVEAGA